MGQGLLVRRGGGGASANLQSINILSNGRYQASDYDVDGWNDIEVAVPMSFTSIDLSISQNGSYVPSDYSVDAFGNVTVDVQYATSALNVIDNGVYNPSDYGVQGFSEVTVSVPTTDRLDAFLNKTISGTIYNDFISVCNDMKFANLSLVDQIILPNVSRIQYNSVFYNCSNVKYISLSSQVSLSSYVVFSSSTANTSYAWPRYLFAFCSLLEEVNGLLNFNIPASCFFACSSLKKFSLGSLCSIIYSYAFDNCIALSSVEGSNVITIYESAFINCRSLESVNFPMVTNLNSNVFNGCVMLSNINMSKLRVIGYSAFRNAGLTAISFETVTYMSGYAFYLCSNAEFVSLPVCSTVLGNMSVFANCYNISYVYMPVFTNVGQYTFGRCSKLSRVYIWKLTGVQQYTFASCEIEYAIFPNLSGFANYAFMSAQRMSFAYFATSASAANINGQSIFQYCNYLVSVIFNYSFVATLQGTGTALSSNNRYIYVKSSLVELYKSSTNWIYMSSRILALETLSFSFYYNDAVFSAYLGSTWGEFVDSADNTLGFYSSGSIIYDSSGNKIYGITVSTSFSEPLLSYMSTYIIIDGSEYACHSDNKWHDFVPSCWAESKFSIFLSSYGTSMYFVHSLGSSAIKMRDSNGSVVNSFDSIVLGSSYYLSA